MTKSNEKYTILDGMECKVATADCFVDAMDAAEKYAKSGCSIASVMLTATGQIIWWTR
jgi:hypothetical protein